MKKSHLLLGLGISISLLTACQNSSSSSSTTEATTQTTVAPKPLTDYTLYNSVLEDYKQVVENVTNSNGQKNQLPTIKMLIQLLIP